MPKQFMQSGGRDAIVTGARCAGAATAMLLDRALADAAMDAGAEILFGVTLDTLKGLHTRLSAAMKAEHAHMIGNATPQLVA